jgi:hypothetical protein
MRRRVGSASVIACIILATTSAHADTEETSEPDADPYRPKLGALGVDARLAGRVGGGHGFEIAPIMGQFGLGARLGERWYLGGTTAYGLMLTDDASAVFQAGAEARYTFHQGKGSLRINHGPSQPIPSLWWLGLRSGYESSPHPRGGFSEVALAQEFWIGHVQTGVVHTLGLAMHHQLSAYFGWAWRVAFDL